MNTQRLLDLADFIESTPGPVGFGLNHCLISWTSRFAGANASYFNGPRAAAYLGLRHDWQKDEEADLVFYGWPKSMTGLDGQRPSPDVRDLILLNLRHWAAVGRVEWIDSLGQPVDENGDPLPPAEG